MSNNFDIIVIGAGPGGYVAAIRAAQLGFSVGLIEKNKLGGVCLNIGCIPTKALLKSADVFQYITHAKDYGIDIVDAKVHFAGMIKRSRDVAEGMSKGIEFLMKKNKITVIKGAATFNKDKSLSVKDDTGKVSTYTAKHIIIATGAKPRSLPSMPIDGKKIISSTEAMMLPTQPKKMIIVGAGAIGVEFAYFYQSIGTQVVLVELQKNILPVEDEEISRTLERIYRKNGMEIKTESLVEKVEHTPNGVKAHIKTPAGIETVEADVLLSAVGVAPHTDGLGLENVGVTTNKAGWIEVDQWYQTKVPGIYAIGDVNGTGPWLAHVASAEGIICVEKIKGLHVEPLDYSNIPGCTYCTPQVASVGLTEKKAKELGYQIKVGKFPFTASGKAKASGKSDGLVKVIFDAKYGEWLGCHLIGDGVTDMIAEAVVARKLETTGHEIIKSVHPHPTLSEAIMEATADAYGEVIHM